MDAEHTQLPDGIGNRAQVDNALRAIHQKKPVPEIDFTLHTMEDGTQVSTMERVCKGLCPLF
jgi:serine/threonine-protein phosphatase 2B catalytic subunit